MADYRIIIPFILEKEGGLSRATTDTASKSPAPCTINGVTGWHTNKGVTYSTFKSLSSKLGYQPSCSNFQNMPSDIWQSIFKKGYWDALNLDSVNSQAVANVAADFAWGAGPKTAAKKLQYAVNTVSGSSLVVDGVIGPKTIKAINASNQQQLFDVYASLKDSYYKSLPNQQANQKGWSIRHFDLLAFSQKYLTPVVGLSSFLLLAGLFFLVRYFKNKR